MKFQLTFKSPDAISEAVYDLRKKYPAMHKDDINELVYNTASEYVRYGEYITVEFDTETNEAVLIKRND